jgi:hypothetical protein
MEYTNIKLITIINIIKYDLKWLLKLILLGFTI